MTALLIGLLLLVSCVTQKTIGSASASAEGSYATKTSPGEVAIDLTPVRYADGMLTVAYAFNTHTVDLSVFDLQEQITLVADGRQYKPIDLPVLSGHHNQGELRFSLPALPDSFGIVIKDIPDIAERRFSWP